MWECVFLVCICSFALCYLPKLNRGIAVVFSADFLYTFSIKMFPTKYSIN